jgi:type II secretory pathway pseudopilin PulG
MVMVIAIIVILASALLFGVSGYIQGTNNAKNDVDAQANQVEANVHISEQKLADYGF